MAKRYSKGKAGRAEEQRPATPPAPGAEWGDEDEFERFWGKSLGEIIAECEREDADAGERKIYMSDEEFLAALRREMKPQPRT